MRRASGFVAIKQFAHKAKHRKSASKAKRSQGWELTAWQAVAAIKNRVDVERANSRGLLYEQVFDPTPRLVRG